MKYPKAANIVIRCTMIGARPVLWLDDIVYVVTLTPAPGPFCLLA